MKSDIYFGDGVHLTVSWSNTTPVGQKFVEGLSRRVLSGLGLPPDFLDAVFHPDEKSLAE